MEGWNGGKVANRGDAISYILSAEKCQRNGDNERVERLTAILADAKQATSPAPVAAQEPVDTLDWPAVKGRINKAFGALAKAGHNFYGALPNETMGWGFVETDWKAWGKERGVPDHMMGWTEQHREPLLEFLAWIEGKVESLAAKIFFA
jgi:hypothetical protein